MSINKDYLTPIEVGRLLKVSPITVRYWANAGLIKAITTPGGHRRFAMREIERFARERGVATEEFEHKSLRILIVDDDSHVANYLKEAFTANTENTVVAIAKDGFDAGRLVPAFNPNIVLLDLMMPGLNGFEVCRRLKNDPLTNHIRIVAMTGYAFEDVIEQALCVGAEACLSKPLNMRELWSIINDKNAERRGAVSRVSDKPK